MFFYCFIHFALAFTHFAVNHAFGFRRQLGGDLLFGAAQDKRVNDFGQQRGAVGIFVFINRIGEFFFEMGVAAQQAGVEEVELGV